MKIYMTIKCEKEPGESLRDLAPRWRAFKEHIITLQEKGVLPPGVVWIPGIQPALDGDEGRRKYAVYRCNDLNCDFYGAIVSPRGRACPFCDGDIIEEWKDAVILGPMNESGQILG